jgi:hypothetical protein
MGLIRLRGGTVAMWNKSDLQPEPCGVREPVVFVLKSRLVRRPKIRGVAMPGFGTVSRMLGGGNYKIFL